MDQTKFELLEAPIFCGAGPKKRIVNEADLARHQH